MSFSFSSFPNSSYSKGFASMSLVTVRNVLRKSLLSGSITGIQHEKANRSQSLRWGEEEDECQTHWTFGSCLTTMEWELGIVGSQSLPVKWPLISGQPNSIPSLRLLMVKPLTSGRAFTGPRKALSPCTIHLPAPRRNRRLIPHAFEDLELL